jgi:DNA-binding NarL/FixJ family response regulator
MDQSPILVSLAMSVERKMDAARVYIVDEHADVRFALAERLARASNLRVIGHSGDAEEVMSISRESKPDVVLVEVKRSDGLGLELLRQLSMLPHEPRVAVLTSYPSSWERQAAQRAGAIAYLLKDIDSEELIRSISLLVDA